MDLTPFLTNFQMLEDMTNNAQQLLLPLLGGNPFLANIYQLVPFKLFLFILALTGLCWAVLRGISLTKSCCTASIFISSEDESYQIVLRWLATKFLGARHLRAKTVYHRWTEEWHPGPPVNGKHFNFSDEGRIRLLPGENGSAVVWDGWRLFHISMMAPRLTVRNGNMAQGESGIIISCLGRSPSTVLNLLKALRVAHRDPGKMSIMRQVTHYPGKTGWGKTQVRGRHINTVHLPEKDQVLDDINTYLGNSDWYKERGIPYRRGYIFYGPPGNGKTSFTLAIACHFGLPLYTLHLGNLQPDELRSLVFILPRYCVVLLEDIDSVRFRGDGDVDSGEARHDSKNKGIALSDLLNAIDGIDSPEGRVLIATANNPESLPSALTRPGRFDQRVLFPPPTHKQVSELAQRIYQCSTEEAERLAEAIPGTLSMAIIQEFLIQHKSIPKRKEVENWSWGKEAGWEHEGSILQ